MTKIALKGSVDGTGSLTLKAPVTTENRELEFSIPAAGQTLAVADASGMPLGPGGDPVVESGSNSDGDWTRWADGTQRCSYQDGTTTTTLAVVTGYVSGSVIKNYPVAFAAPPEVAASFYRISGVEVHHCVIREPPTATEVQFRGHTGQETGSGRIAYVASGRWK